MGPDSGLLFGVYGAAFEANGVKLGSSEGTCHMAGLVAVYELGVSDALANT